MIKPKANVMLKFGLIMFVANLLLSIFLYVTHNKEGGLMYLVASIIWLVGVFIWARNVENGD